MILGLEYKLQAKCAFAHLNSDAQKLLGNISSVAYKCFRGKLRRLSQKTSTLEGQHNTALVKHFFADCNCFWLQVQPCIQLNLVEETRTVWRQVYPEARGCLRCEDKVQADSWKFEERGQNAQAGV